MPRSPGHVFYDRLQLVLIEGGFDGFAEAVCQPYYAARMGAPSVPPGRYFRMHLVGYFEGIDSERGLEWRCSDSLSLREFLLLEMRERVPDHSWLSRTRARLPHEVHTAVFDWVLALIAEAGLVKGERIGVDASTMEANAALRNIVRRDTGEGYRGMLERLAQESGIETPTAEDLARLDRKRKGKKLSNQDWVSRSDPEAKIAKMKDGTTHLAYKPEHAVDLDTGAGGGAHPAGGRYDASQTLAAAEANLEAVDVPDPAECVTDKGYTHGCLRSTTAPGRAGSPSPSRRVLRAGTEMMRLAGRSPTTGPGCYRGWPGKPSSCAPRSSSAPLPTTSIAAVCAGPGFGAARTCTSDTCFTSPATTYRC